MSETMKVDMKNVGQRAGEGSATGSGIGELMSAGPLGIALAVLFFPVRWLIRKARGR